MTPEEQVKKLEGQLARARQVYRNLPPPADDGSLDAWEQLEAILCDWEERNKEGAGTT